MEWLGIFPYQRGETKSLVLFQASFQVHGEGGDDFEGNLLLHICGLFYNLSPYAQWLGTETKLPFFGELLAVVHSFVVELLAEPHTMIKNLAERTRRTHVFYSIPYCSSMEIPHLTKIWVLWCSWRSNMFKSLRFNPVSHFHPFNSESDLVFKPISQSCDWFFSCAFV